MRSFTTDEVGRGKAGQAASGGGDGWGEGGESSARTGSVRMSELRSSSGGVVGSQTTRTGERYLVSEGGDKFIAASQRSDGSSRKQIRVRMGFITAEDQSKYRSKLAESRETVISVAAAGGGPPGWSPPVGDGSKAKSGKPKKPTKRTEDKKSVGTTEEELVSELNSKLLLEDNEQTRSKKLRAMRKKLREIEALEESLLRNETDPTSEQQQKLSRKQEVIKEIEELEAATS
eukprot:GHVS01011782.1.p1 GENE.GHVS01011782.1~~GHVS01011782.1.p1  ORF type:complete len:232 (-),score=49.35 GHVS01011782.1:1239-1934(-)